MSVDVLLAADRACFGSRDLDLIGWLAPPGEIGGISNGIVPSWLGEELSPYPVLWVNECLPSETSGTGCAGYAGPAFMFLYAPPDSGLPLGAPSREVEVTGHFADPVASTCNWGGTGEPVSVDDAVATCRRHFAVTGVRNWLPPGASVRTRVADLRVRQSPSLSGAIAATLTKGRQLLVGPSGPITAEGQDWYFVTWRPGGVPPDQGGFVAIGTGAVPYLDLVSVTCGDQSAPTVASIALLTLYAREVCLGGRTIGLTGTVISGFGGLAPGTYQPGWLADPFGFDVIQDDAHNLFYYRMPPDITPPSFADGTRIRVSGHFADPASATCAIVLSNADGSNPRAVDPATAHTYCLEMFVATAIAPAP